MDEKKKRNQYAYDKRAYDHIHLQVPKGAKERIQEAASDKGYASLNSYLKALIEQDSGLGLGVKREGE